MDAIGVVAVGLALVCSVTVVVDAIANVPVLVARVATVAVVGVAAVAVTAVLKK